MKSKMILAMIAITLLVTGCTQTKSTNETAEEATPEEAISSMFTALKTADAASFHSLVQYKRKKDNGIIIETERIFGGSLDDESKTYMEAVFEKLDYKVISTDDITDEQTVFTLEITNKNLSEVDASDYSSLDNPVMAEITAIKGMTEIVTKIVDVEVVKSGKGRQVVIDDELRNALLGNKKGILDILSNWLP